MSDEIHVEVVHGAATVGAALAAARTAHGHSVEQIAAQLRLTSAQVKAIEAGNFGVLPGTVFARGYVRNYARLLKMDETRLLSELAQPEPAMDVHADVRMLRDPKGVVIDPVRWRGVSVAAGVVAVVLGALAYYEFVLNEVHGVKPMPATVTPATVAAQISLDTQSDRQSSPAVSEQLSQQETSKPPAGDTPVRRGLHFLFRQESWVEVRDGLGNLLFSQVNLPGTERVIQGDPPFRIVVGGARGVQLAYNGNLVDLVAHATEDVARLRLE